MHYRNYVFFMKINNESIKQNENYTFLYRENQIITLIHNLYAIKTYNLHMQLKFVKVLQIEMFQFKTNLINAKLLIKFNV